MMRKGLIAPLLVMGAAFAATQSSNAASLNPGWYVQGGAGANWVTGSDIEVGGTQPDADYNLGWLGALSGGYSWANGLRLELEGAYRSNGVDTLGGVNAGGDAKLGTLMLNAIYAFPTTGWVQPFIGIGAGGGRLKLDSVGPIAGTSVDDSSWSGAFQGIVGAEYAITQNLGLNLSYRYLISPWNDFTAANGTGADLSYHSHAVLVALRWSFGAPPAPMMVAEPPRQQAQAPRPAPTPPARQEQPPRQYLVFFDFDSSALTTDAQSIVRTAAQSSKQMGITRLEVTGHADRSGTDRYNMRLSQRRAESVRAELIRQGVSANDIAIFAKGESQPLVPTADGVREPQNRRVQIVFP